MIYNWSYHQISDNKNVGKTKDLLATNKNALKSLIHTASGNYDFRKTHTIFKAVK